MAGGGGAVGGRALAVPPRRCTCRRGYGDAGCNVAVPRLAVGQTVERTMPVATWLHFEINVSGFPPPPPPPVPDNWFIPIHFFLISPRMGGVSCHI